LLDIPIICCGIPASFGQHHFHLVRPDCEAEAVRRVHQCMEAWAEETHCGALIWKEWSPDQGVREHLCREGYVVLPTLPDHIVMRLPSRVDIFVGSMRSSYRRKYRTAAALMTGPGPVWTRAGLRVEVGRFTRDDARQFHTGYERLMARTPVRLETYPETFFVNLAESAVDVRRLHLVSEESGQSLTALLIPSGTTLQFALVSKQEDRYEDALYTVLLQCIVLYAVRAGFEEVRLGQTSAYAKCSIGAQPRRLETFIRMRSPLKHRVLKRCGALLFPEADTPPVRVFRRAGRDDASSQCGAHFREPS
jgi:hypothetical protein